MNSKKLYLFLLFFFSILSLNFSASPNSFAETETIKITSPSEDLTYSDLNNYQLLIETDSEKNIIYSSESITDSITIPGFNDGQKYFESVTIETTGKVTMTDKGRIVPKSVGKVKITACLENTEICDSKIFTIFPDQTSVDAGYAKIDQDEIEFIYNLNDQPISDIIGRTLVVGDFLNTDFKKVEESSAILKVISVTTTTKEGRTYDEKVSTTNLWFPNSKCNLSEDNLHIECPFYHPHYFYHEKTITKNIIATTYPPNEEEEHDEEEEKHDDEEGEHDKEEEKHNDDSENHIDEKEDLTDEFEPEITDKKNSSENRVDKLEKHTKETFPFTPNTGKLQIVTKKYATENLNLIPTILFSFALILVIIRKNNWR